MDNSICEVALEGLYSLYGVIQERQQSTKCRSNIVEEDSGRKYATIQPQPWAVVVDARSP